jgi:hypothetical protein
VSSRGRMCSELDTIVTAEPIRAKAWPSSTPTGPPPITRRRAGRRSASKTVSFVRYPASRNPGIQTVTAHAVLLEQRHPRAKHGGTGSDGEAARPRAEDDDVVALHDVHAPINPMQRLL